MTVNEKGRIESLGICDEAAFGAVLDATWAKVATSSKKGNWSVQVQITLCKTRRVNDISQTDALRANSI
jgi:hypothetical protein